MSAASLWVVGFKGNNAAVSAFKGGRGTVRLQLRRRGERISAVSASAVATRSTSEEKVYEVVMKQAALVREHVTEKKAVEGVDGLSLATKWVLLSEAYDRCGEICAEYAKTFYLGTLLMTPNRRKAVWAIYGNSYIFSLIFI